MKALKNRVAVAEPRLPEEVRRLGVTTAKRSPDITLVVNLISPEGRYDKLYIDNYAYLQKTLPFAQGMSYRNQPSEELTARMIRLCQDKGYHGWYGIESGGREEVKKGIRLLRQHLFAEMVG